MAAKLLSTRLTEALSAFDPIALIFLINTGLIQKLQSQMLPEPFKTQSSKSKSDISVSRRLVKQRFASSPSAAGRCRPE